MKSSAKQPASKGASAAAKAQPSQTAAKEAPKTLAASITLLEEYEKEKQMTQPKKDSLETFINNDFFAKEKFFSSITDKETPLILTYVKKAIVLSTHLKHAPRSALVLLSVANFWPSHTIRRPALDIIMELIAPNSRNRCAFAKIFLELIQNNFLEGVSRRLHKQKNPSSEDIYTLTGHDICRVLNALLHFESKKEEGQEFYLDFLVHSLLLCSLDSAVHFNGSIWTKWIHSHEEYAELLNSEELCQNIVDGVLKAEKASRFNAIQMLVSLGDVGHKITDAIWDKCAKDLRSIDINTFLDMEDRLVEIYETPEGVLFNTEVIDIHSDANLDVKNLKRENKTYTYKEQLAELQLRKEVAERNRREGILTEKQKKAVAEELKVEQGIREELKKLHDSVQEKMDNVSIAARYNPKGAFLNISLLYDVIVPLLKSKLVAKTCASAFLAFRDAFFEPTRDCIHETVAHSQLRVLGSCFLYKNWCDEPLKDQLNRVFLLLTSACLMFSSFGEEINLDDGADDDAMFNEGITAFKLGFIVPLVNAILLRSNEPAIDTKLKIRVATFLKDAITPTCILEDEVASFSILQLNTILINAILVPGSFDYIDDLTTSLENYCRMLDKCTDKSPPVLDFLRKITSHFFESEPIIRRIMIKFLQNTTHLLMEIFSYNAEFKNEMRRAIYLAIHDQDSDCAKLADVLWYDLRLHTSNDFAFVFMEDLYSANELIRDEAAACIKDLVEKYPEKTGEVLSKLASLYTKLNELISAEYDRIGRKIHDEVDDWQKRSGVAKALSLMAENLPSEHLMTLIKIIVPYGLNDRNEHCRNLMRNAAITAIVKDGKDHVEELLSFLEDKLDNLPSDGQLDNLHQGLIILIGSLARHLENDTKIRKIVARLIEALSTPSQQVQESVANCLPALVPYLRSDARDLIQNLIILLTNGESYGERRGAAYGIASIVKGLGVATIKELDIIGTLRKTLSQSQSPIKREGALLCMEMLCSIVGKLFEPYVVQLLPDLLSTFGDKNDNVRHAADDTAKAVMKALSAHGVKLVLPSLLKALEEDSWRTKCASAELLGAMSHCAPRQLSTSLPAIVPKLCEVLVDTHSKVQKAGEKALRQIAQVIQNPEIMSISSHLLSGLVDPANKTKSSLEIIVNTKFIHYVDSPSLALMMPLIHRAFSDRNTETRRMATQIVASIYSLADHKDMEPYLRDLIPGLKNAITDPAPEVRTVAARALGSIIRNSSENTSQTLQSDIMPWLKDSLVSRTSMVDRSGAAQGLSEVIAALGEDFLAANMPGVIKITEAPGTEPYIRDGYILLYIYLPIVLEEKFLPYVPKIVPSILKALADENEYVRDSALKAGQRLISAYVGHAKKLLLPQLQAAVVDENWRIRHSSIKLIGEFLFNISGVSAKMTSDTAHDDDTLGMETVNKAIVRHIGQKSRDEILSALYLARHDVALVVRQAASHVWKVVVTNTPRTLKDLMKTLFELVIHCLSSSSGDRQQMAARCLGEMVKKMGERILVTVLPNLEERLSSDNVELRKGVATYASSLSPSIKKCLSDPEKEVRDAAAPAFSSFHQMVGYIAVDEIVSPMLDEYSSTNKPDILDGLCSVMEASTSRTLLSNLLPRLTKPPVNSLALCRLAAVAEESVSRNLPKILEALLSNSINTTVEEHVQNAVPVLLSLEDEDDVRTIVTTLLKHSASGNQVVASTLLQRFLTETDADLSELLETLVIGLVALYSADEQIVVENAIDGLKGVTKELESEELLEVLVILKRAVNTLYNKMTEGKKADIPTKSVPGLDNPKGWQPLLQILREGLMTGTVEHKEMASGSMKQLVALSNESGLKPHVVNMAGPLIRVLGDRYPSPTKLAVLNALLKLLEKLPLVLRPFLPQMQSVFLKIFQDPNSSPNTRQAAGNALSKIVEFHPKPESVVNELVKLQKTAENTDEM
ncbi:protein ILITYHIA [Ditylenchus destructor]|nr:protein ILITYHIA [Ditylenchus destructor]